MRIAALPIAAIGISVLLAPACRSRADSAVVRIDTVALRAHAAFLASDELEGRANGSAGQRAAAEYIREQLRRLGISGAGAAGRYDQPLPLSRVDVDQRRTRLIVASATGTDTLSAAQFHLVSGNERSFRDFGGRLVYFGRATDVLRLAPSMGALENVVAVLAPGGGGTSSDEALELLEARGAAGVIVLIRSPELYPRLRNARGRARWFLRAPVLGSGGRALPVVLAGPRVVQRLGQPPPSDSTPLDVPRELGRSVRLELRTSVRQVEAMNVVARIDGADARRRDEAVVIVAHYDHVGFAAAVDGDSLYNGFMDNAVGVAALLAIAKAARRRPPMRSMIFLFVAAEEDGLLGSAYYAANPFVPLGQTIAVLNLDLPAPLAAPTRWHLETNSTPLLELGQAMGRGRGWEVAEAPVHRARTIGASCCTACPAHSSFRAKDGKA